jgi:hypothetical protein
LRGEKNRGAHEYPKIRERMGGDFFVIIPKLILTTPVHNGRFRKANSTCKLLILAECLYH